MRGPEGMRHVPDPAPLERQVTSRHTTEINEKLYDVYRLIAAAEKIPIEVVPINIFDEFKEEDGCWTDTKGQKLGPKQLLQLAKKYDNHFNTMMMANLDWATHIASVRDADYEQYPLLLVGNNFVLDGMHRLVKAWLDNAKELNIQRFTELPAEALIEETSSKANDQS